MCEACGCGARTEHVCPECGGRVILIDGETKCVACGASPSLDRASAQHEDSERHHGGHSHGPERTGDPERQELLSKLRVLLPHWIEHNAEHAESFRKWADRARAAGDKHLAVHIEEAARRIEAANDDLEGVLQHIGTGASDHTHQEHSH